METVNHLAAVASASSFSHLKELLDAHQVHMNQRNDQAKDRSSPLSDILM